MTPRGARIGVVAAAASLVAIGFVVWAINRSPGFEVLGSSMQPTYAPGDVVRMSAGGAHVDRGDIVVVADGRGEEYLKRIVALSGEVVQTIDCQLFVDDVAVPEPYAWTDGGCGTEVDATLVPAGSIFVLGDNRSASLDSRVFGPVAVDDVIASAPAL